MPEIVNNFSQVMSQFLRSKWAKPFTILGQCQIQNTWSFLANAKASPSAILALLAWNVSFCSWNFRMEAVNKEALFEIWKHFRKNTSNSPHDYFTTIITWKKTKIIIHVDYEQRKSLIHLDFPEESFGLGNRLSVY